MDDTCAVCADTLEWVAYGPCGHREVCSTCVSRLRFICNDRRCCICKDESNVVFVTKALGDYTRMISDFSLLPSELKEGRVGSYWCHEATGAFFDDMDHYRMVKAMCLLSCSVCESMDEPSNDCSRKRAKFRNVEQLKGHLFHWHKLVMCSLCLEGRKVFMCEQKLYSRTQLNQHINTGDSEVDGSQDDRGGFSGHPMCEFCRNPFYGDNELFTHMSTEHYTCHICQRQNPGQYEYYKNYDDLEIHFGAEHFLCEDVACLAKKFVVFQSETEMKRHNAMEHGGRMSRAQRSAALQIPTSFRFKRRNEYHGRTRGQSFVSETSANQLSMAIQASLEMVNSASSLQDPSSSSAHSIADRRNVDESDPIIQPFNSLSTSDSEASSRYLEAMSKTRNELGESYFPPLPVAPSSSRQKHSHSGKLPKNSMADHLRRQGKVTVVNSGQAAPSLWLVNSQIKKKKNRGTLASSSSTQSMPMANNPPFSSNGSLQIKPAISNGPSTSHTGPTSGWPAMSQTHVSTGPSSSSNNPAGNNRATHSALVLNAVENKTFKSFKSDFPPVSATQIRKPSTNGEPSLNVNDAHKGNESFKPSISDFPPVSAMQIHKPSVSSKPVLNVKGVYTGKKSYNSSISDFPPVSEAVVHKPSTSSKTPFAVKDVHTENNSLVDNMRAALDFDEDKFNNFKEISGQYRLGIINTVEYLASVQQFGLTHLILDLARLCPDPQKQRELIETYNTNMRGIDSQNGWGNGNPHLKFDSSTYKKGKGKHHLDSESISLKSSLADSVMSSVRELQSSLRPSEVEVEELSKDGYRSSRGKSIMTVEPPQADLSSWNNMKAKSNGQTETSSGSGSNHNTADAGGGSKQKKKASKFLRNRLGDDSAKAYLKGGKHDSDQVTDSLNGKGNSEGLPERSVWRSGVAQKLFKNVKK